VLIMYFWAALIAFGTVAFSVTHTGRTVVLACAGFCLIGLVVLLLPWFKPKAPAAVQAFVPPRYRKGVGRPAKAAAEPVAAERVEVERVEVEPMAELSVHDQELLGRMGTGAHAVGDHQKS
jgi:UDP-GlcNAc:undecaprenyl-phosphate GlcNAc-1-phosphate transferase